MYVFQMVSVPYTWSGVVSRSRSSLAAAAASRALAFAGFFGIVTPPKRKYVSVRKLQCVWNR
jgi:hypothetical protein